MIKIVVALYDRKAEMFMDPFCVPTIGVALRDVGADLNRAGENRLQQFREDFELWQVGSFDVESGFIEGQKAAKICDVASLYVGPESNGPTQLSLN